MRGNVHTSTPCLGMALDRINTPVIEQNSTTYFTHPCLPPVILHIMNGVQKQRIITGMAAFIISTGMVKIRNKVKPHAAPQTKLHITRHLAAYQFASVSFSTNTFCASNPSPP